MQYEDVSIDAVKSMIMGHAVGDALGVPVEFSTREERMNNPVTEMLGYMEYPDMPPGSWSDDTSMTLCLMDSIVQKHGIDYSHIMDNFLRWVDQSAFTPTGKMFDVGRATLQAILKYHNGTEPLLCGGGADYDNGNGSLMRIAPMAVYLYAKYGTELPLEAMVLVHCVSALTHRHPRSRMACGIYVCIAVQLLAGKGLSEAIRAGLSKAKSYYEQEPVFHSEIATYSRLWDIDAFQALPVNEIRSSGYVVDTLEAAIWCLLNTKNYEQCVIGAVNLGEDTDTTGAVAGGLAGLAYGYEAIPARWLDKLQKREELERACEEFHQGIEGTLTALKQERVRTKASADKMEIARKILANGDADDYDDNLIEAFLHECRVSNYNDYYDRFTDEVIEDSIRNGDETKCRAIFTAMWREDHWIGNTFIKRWAKKQPQRLLERILQLWEQ